MNYRETLIRLKTLLELLQQHAEVSSDFLLQNLQVSRTTLQRDIENLQNLGHDIEYCRKRKMYVLMH